MDEHQRSTMRDSISSERVIPPVQFEKVKHCARNMSTESSVWQIT